MLITIPTLTGTTVKASKSKELSNNDKFTITFTLNKGYVWKDGTSKPVNLKYKVSGLLKGVAKPIVATGKVEGINNYGIFTATPLTGTTITSAPVGTAKKDKYKTGDQITVTYTLNAGYAWEGGGTDVVNSIYTVGTLQNGIAIPTKSSVPLTFTGIQGHGTFVLPTAPKNTTVKITAGGSGQTPLATLSNNDTVTLSFTPTQGNIWTDNTNTAKTVDYTVSGLKEGIIIPTKLLVPVTFSGTQGKGTFTMPSYANTNITITAGGTAKVPSTTLSTGTKVTLSFVPIGTNAWTDNTKTAKTVDYIVPTLPTGVIKPTLTTIAKATGTAGKGSYTIKQFTGMTGTIKSGDKTSNLKNGDTIIITYKLKEGYKWEDNTRSDVTLNLIVSGLQKIDIQSGRLIMQLSSIGKTTGPKYTGAEVYTKVRTIISSLSMYTVGEIKESSTIEISVRQSSSVPVPDSNTKILADSFSINVKITSANKNINKIFQGITNIQNGAKS